MSSINLQQLPKKAGLLRTLTARPGHTLIFTDCHALEPSVLTEFSQDKNLMLLYGPGAKPNQDVYLNLGLSFVEYRDQILATGYGTDYTAETLEKAKSLLKKERGVLKTIALGLNYKMGVTKLALALNLVSPSDPFSIKKGKYTMPNMTLPGCRKADELIKAYWTHYAGVKKFYTQLEHEWSRNYGYIVNGRGRPMCVPEEYKKDLGNRFVQSTGHDVLIQLLMQINRFRKELCPEMRPWIPDEHDATIWEVPEEKVELAKQVFGLAFDTLNNDILKWTVKIRGDTKIGRSMELKL